MDQFERHYGKEGAMEGDERLLEAMGLRGGCGHTATEIRRDGSIVGWLFVIAVLIGATVVCLGGS